MPDWKPAAGKSVLGDSLVSTGSVCMADWFHIVPLGTFRLLLNQSSEEGLIYYLARKRYHVDRTLFVSENNVEVLKVPIHKLSFIFGLLFLRTPLQREFLNSS